MIWLSGFLGGFSAGIGVALVAVLITMALEARDERKVDQ